MPAELAKGSESFRVWVLGYHRLKVGSPKKNTKGMLIDK